MRPSQDPGAAIGARLDRLPMTWPLWRWVLLLSGGAFFEIYDLFLTAYLSPGLVRAGIFRPEGAVFWGLSSQATFAAVTFGGLYVGTVAFSAVADRFGRRPIFTCSLLWYTVATIMMAVQSTAAGIYCWRFVAGVGIGVELVTIDAYLAEFVPKHARTRAFACNAAVQFLGVPAAAFLAWILVPRSPWGIDGWRWVALISAAGALVVWAIRSRVPESPRWLAEHGRTAEADRIVGALEVAAGAAPLAVEPATAPQVQDTPPHPFRRVIAMLVVFQFFQTIGFYGFGNWLPTLLAARGASIVHSLQYSFAIALAYPVGPLLCLAFADRFEAKWQIVVAALGVAGFGLLFAAQTGGVGIVLCGILVTFSNCAMSYAYHAYQTELFPTRIRARAVGFCYSWSRLSTVFSSFMIAFFLGRFGPTGVFIFIASSMAVVALVIGGLGPRTRGRSLEEIAARTG
jgi:putative MFS transporter